MTSELGFDGGNCIKINWNPEGYPSSYLEGFEISDEEAVGRFLDSKSDKENYPNWNTVIIERSPERGTMVWVRHGVTRTQVNWSEPKRVPRDYIEYPREFNGFYGPDDKQTSRAELLSKILGIGLIAEYD